MKTAFITGATGGVGRALAGVLEAEGYRLVISDRDESALEAMSFQLSHDPECITADLMVEEDVGRLCARLESPAAPIDLLINNAGIIVPGPVSEVSTASLKAHVEINLTQPMILSAAAARSMKTRRAGHIFSIVSLAGIIPLKNSAAYSASKFGLRGFMAALSMELKPYGIGVGSLFPSAIDTPLLAEEMASPSGSPLNFVGGSQPLSPLETAQASLKAIKTNKLETWLPKGDGRSGGLVMTFPSLLGPISEHLEKKGEKKKQAYLQRLAQT